MPSLERTTDTPPPPPCPVCGGTAKSESVRRQSGAMTGDYLCKNGHIWTTRWLVGA